IIAFYTVWFADRTSFKKRLRVVGYVLICGIIEHIFLCHLSEHNNTPELAYRESLPFAGDASLAPLPRQSASPLIILR
ncbi:MAG: hypothetical protein II556_02615, partial [Bacteroidales bacterium]|nr:hypothetical protein [Bacteroidales bacterium]